MVSNKITTSNPLQTPATPSAQPPAPKWVGDPQGLSPNTVRIIRNAMVSFHGGMIQELGDAFSRDLSELRKARPDHENHHLEGTPLWVQSREGGREAWLPTDATKDLLSRLGRERLTQLVEEHADHVRGFLEQRHADSSRRVVVLTPGVDGAFAWITDGEHRLLHILPWPRAKDERRASAQPQTRPWQLPARIGKAGGQENTGEGASSQAADKSQASQRVPELSAEWVHHLVMTGIAQSDHRDEDSLRVERAQEYAREYRAKVDDQSASQQQRARDARADRAAEDQTDDEEVEEQESETRRRDRLLQDRAKTVIPVDHKPDLELRDHEDPDGEPHLQKVEGVHRENPYHK